MGRRIQESQWAQCTTVFQWPLTTRSRTPLVSMCSVGAPFVSPNPGAGLKELGGSQRRCRGVLPRIVIGRPDRWAPLTGSRRLCGCIAAHSDTLIVRPVGSIGEFMDKKRPVKQPRSVSYKRDPMVITAVPV